VGVGAEEQVAKFVGENVPEHVGVRQLWVVRAEHEVLEVDIGVDAALASRVDQGLTEGFG